MAVRTSVTSSLTNEALQQLEEKRVAQKPVMEEQVQEPQAQEPTVNPFSAVAKMGAAQEAAPETLEAVQAGVEAGIQREQELAEDAKRGEILPLNVRYNEAVAPVVYDYKGLEKDEPTNDGGMIDRARNLSNRVVTPGDGQISIGGTSVNADNNAMLQSLVAADAFDVDDAGNRSQSPNKMFLQTLSLVAENYMYDLFQGESILEDPEVSGISLPEDSGNGLPTQSDKMISKAKMNSQIGKQIHREWKRIDNSRKGLPLDDFKDISNEDATALGDLAKELYFTSVNDQYSGGNLIERGTFVKGDKQVYLQLTKLGSEVLGKSSQARKKMFPKQNLRTQKAKPQGGRAAGAVAREKKTFSTKGGAIVNAEVINEAMRNLSTVSNVVRPERLKIFLMTVIPVLQGQEPAPGLLSQLNHVGQDKLNKFISKANKDKSVDVDGEYAKLLNDLAQDVFGIVLERKGANYLTYYMQGFNGRIAPQQSTLDPTTSKSARFVTSNGKPSIVDSKTGNGRRIERNLRQMYAQALVKDADSLLPQGREQALEKATPQLVKWGLKLKGILSGVSDAQVEAVAQAIEQGIPVNDPSFPKLPQVSLDPVADLDLIEAISSKGEDGQMFIDGLVDFANYYEVKTRAAADKKANRSDGNYQYPSFFNAYMDGKTNGLATNGMQMGSIQIAYRTGVLRSQNKTLLDFEEDIRDQLKDTLLKSVDDGFEGHTPEIALRLSYVATELFSVRDLNKATTMTFGYGKELGSFKFDIDEFLSDLEVSNTDIAERVKSLTSDLEGRSKLIDILHAKYIPALVSVLDDDALKSRSVMRSVAMLHGLSNELFSLESPTGYMLNMGASEYTGEQTRDRYDIGVFDEASGKRIKRGTEVGRFESEITSAASKRYTRNDGSIELVPGEIAYGGSVPAPVQAVDAATVALTATGRSWNKLKAKSNGDPYLHTIYDAFKVDAMGYDTVLEEVNQNWLDINMQWSYLEKAQESLIRLRTSFKDRYQGRSDTDPLTRNESAVINYLLTKDDNGNYPNLINKLMKVMDLDPKDLSEAPLGEATEASNRIVNALRKNSAMSSPPNVKTIKTFMGAFSKELNIDFRLKEMISKTNSEKKKLLAKMSS